MSRRKKIIIAIIVAVLLLTVGVLVFFYLYGREAPVAPEEPGEFPSTEDTGFPPEETTPTVLPEESTKAGPVLRQLTTTPVAGAIIAGSGTKVAVRYVDRATGNVFEISPDGGAAKRITNTTIPKIYEAFFAKSGTSLIARYLKEDNETIETFSGTVKTKSGGQEGDLTGSFFPANIKALALSPEGNRVFYLREENGGAVGITTTIAGAAKTEVFRSPLREWNAAWPKTDIIMLTSKPSALAEGIIQFLNPETGGLTPILSRLRGLTALADGSAAKILYSWSQNTGLSASIFERKSRAQTKLSLPTLPEKCVFAGKAGEKLYCGVPNSLPPASYPDAWYQGIISFEDEVWTFDTTDAIPRLIMDVSAEAKTPLDIVYLALSSDEQYLIFTNKTDGTLWSLQLSR